MTNATTAKKAAMGIITTGALMAAIAGAVLMFIDNYIGRRYTRVTIYRKTI